MTSTGFLLVGFYRPQTKLRKGNVFTPVCQSFCLQGGVCPVHARIHPLPWADNPPPPPTATAGDGTHPTGMLSCYQFH